MKTNVEHQEPFNMVVSTEGKKMGDKLPQMCKAKENSYKAFKQAKNVHSLYQGFNGNILILTIMSKFKTSALIVFAKLCVHSSLE